MDVQVQVHVEDFENERHRRIAGVYWNHQRDEGELVFNAFLTILGSETNDPSLTELAVQLVDEVEGLSPVDVKPEERDAALDGTLADAIAFLNKLKSGREQQKLLATLKRTSEEKLSEQDELSLFEELVKKNQSADLRRLGPVKRMR